MATLSLNPAGLQISVIRQFRVRWHGADVPIRSRPVRALLAYLVLAEGMSELRERLATLLWANLSEAQGRKNLRQTLYDLRAQLPAEARQHVFADRNRVSLETGSIDTEESDLLSALHDGRIPNLLTSASDISERLLDDIEPPCETYVGWLRLRRREFSDSLRGELSRIMESGTPEATRHAAEALLKLDPTDEGAVRHLVSAAASAGDTARALRLYRDLWDLLDAEFGSEPAEETQALIVRIKQAGAEAPATKTAAKPLNRETQRPELRVEPLQFPGASASPTVPLLFRSEVLACLGRFRAWRVIDGEFAERPGDFVIRLMTTGPDLSASIIARASGDVLWSTTVPNLEREWLRLREVLAGSIAAACDISLTRARLAEIASRGTPADAVDEWLLGQQKLDAFRPEDWTAAEQHFQSASERDPSFARALSSLSQTRNIRHLAFPGVYPIEASLRESLDFANRAVAADPFDAQTHLCRAWASLLLWEFAQAETSFALALRCNADEPWTVISTALGYAFMGETETAASLMNRFQEEGWTMTHWPWGYRANICFLAGDLEGCLEACANAGDSIINMPAWAASASALLGRTDEAAGHWARFEQAARPHWRGAAPPTSQALLDWFSALFPLRKDADQERLVSGARMAMETYLHCETE